MIEFNKSTIVYFLMMAKLAAAKSKDTSTRVGCILVNPENRRVISTGYNGFPVGIEDDVVLRCDRYNNREERLLFTVHAEANAIAGAAASTACTNGAYAFVTLHPCTECTKLLINAGIKRIYYLAEKNATVKAPAKNDWRPMMARSRAMLVEAGVEVFECNISINPTTSAHDPLSIPRITDIDLECKFCNKVQ